MRWLAAPRGTLVFVREAHKAGEGDGAGRRLACAVNLGGGTVRVPASGTPLLASGPVHADGDHMELPPDTALWWDVKEDG